LYTPLLSYCYIVSPSFVFSGSRGFLDVTAARRSREEDEKTGKNRCGVVLFPLFPYSRGIYRSNAYKAHVEMKGRYA